jgi:hypothetical protein
MASESEDIDRLVDEWAQRTERLPATAYVALHEIFNDLRGGGFTETQALRIIAVLIAENGDRHGTQEE